MQASVKQSKMQDIASSGNSTSHPILQSIHLDRQFALRLILIGSSGEDAFGELLEAVTFDLAKLVAIAVSSDFLLIAQSG